MDAVGLRDHAGFLVIAVARLPDRDGNPLEIRQPVFQVHAGTRVAEVAERGTGLGAFDGIEFPGSHQFDQGHDDRLPGAG